MFGREMGMAAGGFTKRPVGGRAGCGICTGAEGRKGVRLAEAAGESATWVWTGVGAGAGAEAGVGVGAGAVDAGSGGDGDGVWADCGRDLRVKTED